MILALFAIVLTLILVVGIHEGGHAIAAQYFGVTIKKISIGFGRPLIQWRSTNGCEWVWAIWPLGGYVQLLNSRVTSVDPKDYSRCFDKKPIGARILILLAGVIANVLVAWCAFVVVFYSGLHYKLPQVQDVRPQSVAFHAGLAPGDQFISIGGHATPSWQEVGMELVILWGKKEVSAVVHHADQKDPKKVTLDLSQIRFTGSEHSLFAVLGMTPNRTAPSAMRQASSFFAAIQQASHALFHMIYFFMMILKQVLSGVIPFSILLGPIGLFAASITSLQQGIVVFMYFIANFSLAVAVVNLFPVPGLDGGSIVYSVIEKIRGKPITVAMEVLLYQLMFIVFCVLLVNLITNDLKLWLHD